MADQDAWIARWRATAISLGMSEDEANGPDMEPEIRGYYSPTRAPEDMARDYMESVFNGG